MKKFLLLVVVFLSANVFSADFKLVCHTDSFTQVTSQESEHQSNVKNNVKIHSKQIIIVMKKSNNILYRIIFKDGNKYDGQIVTIPILKSSDQKYFASIIRLDNIESFVVDIENDEITRSYQSSDLIIAKYAKCFKDND